MANIMTTSDNAVKAGTWKMKFRYDIVLNILNYIKTVADQVYTDIAASISTAVSGEIQDNIDAAIATAIAGEISDDLAAAVLASGSVELSAVFTAPDAGLTEVFAAVVLTDAAQPGLATGITPPDMARCLVVTPTMAGATLAGNVVVHGTNINDEVISETFALADAANVVGVKAFKTVTAVDLPARTSVDDQIGIAVTEKLGFPVLLTEDTIYMALVDGARDTLPTTTVSASDISQCVVLPATNCNGAKTFKFFYHI